MNGHSFHHLLFERARMATDRRNLPLVINAQSKWPQRLILPHDIFVPFAGRSIGPRPRQVISREYFAPSPTLRANAGMVNRASMIWGMALWLRQPRGQHPVVRIRDLVEDTLVYNRVIA